MKKARVKLEAMPRNSSLRPRRSIRPRRDPLESESQKQALKRHFEYLNRFANDIILLTDQKWNILEANERAVHAYGYGRQALLKLHLRDLRVPGERGKLAAEYRRTEKESGSIFTRRSSA